LLENLKSNKDLLDKGKKYNFYYFLVESSFLSNKEFQIDNFAYFYQLNHINFEANDNKSIKDAIKKLKYYKNVESGTQFYLLRIKIVDIAQKKFSHPITKLSDVVDPEIGIGVSPSNICTDLLNLFSLYFRNWFKITSNFLFWEAEDSYLLIKSEFQKIPQCKESNVLTLNYNNVTQLRNEQFYLIQKSLSRFNQSLKSIDTDLDLALILLVSTIENLSRKYGDVEEQFDENNEFYRKLRKTFKKSGLEKTIEASNLEDIFNLIGEAYLKLSYLQNKAKYKDFCLKYVSSQFLNEKFEEMISNLYDLRSKILHAGESLGFWLREKIIMYNPRTKSGKIKQFVDEKGKHPIIIRIPSYNDLLKILGDILVNFLRYLFSVRDDENDKILYKASDIKKRNMIIGAISKDGIKPGYVVNLNKDFYRRVDYIDLIQIQNKLRKIEKNYNKKNHKESLLEVEKITKDSTFTIDYAIFRRACYFKISFLIRLNKFDECLKMFDTYNINEINDETHPIFNEKAYCLAKLGEFNEAHKLIDEILSIVKENDEYKANYLDSKGDFYKFAGDYANAIKFYTKSLEIKRDPPFPFHEEIERKLEELKKNNNI